MTTEPAGLNPRTTTRGRPRTTGTTLCARCGRNAGRARVWWPEGKVCGPCFTTATRTHGTCPGCGQHRLLPGPPHLEDGPRCAHCAGIPHDFHCTRCGTEAEPYRHGTCARCSLRDDLTALLLAEPADPAAMGRLVDVLCQAERPESIITWKRSPKVQTLLASLAAGTTSLTHGGLDTHIPTAARAVDHLRALLVHHGLLPYQDPYLARFEAWIEDKLRPLAPEVARPVEHFARWHHLRRIRSTATPESPARGPVHSAKQEITETAKFLQWLWETHHRNAASCTQQDADEWRASGPTTRKLIRTFFVFARKTRLNTSVDIGYYTAQSRPTLAQDRRLAWLRELLTGTSESRPYRVAGILLLLYAQPLVRVAALRADAITVDPATGQTYITFGVRPVPVPAPFGDLLLDHLECRPNLRTGVTESPWLFPGARAGHHLHPNTIMDRLRSLGIDLQGARNRALDDLVTQMPPSVVADALGYSYQVAFLHANAAGENWARYADLKRPVTRP
ncbi:recombinase XerD [Sinomonas terrae]|uniref:Recombinase XerD n=2 Tax=Sinomonas terrae TaxID=2908838 RepID=A0ABS9U762_9MICC|nr:recombinase XerD [Sinomonas terrae]MCH6470355.1 recombinase XerD [Sinomonas terrae]MCH6472520.1 recombinase XerD [Sinomonas terrae]